VLLFFHAFTDFSPVLTFLAFRPELTWGEFSFFVQTLRPALVLLPACSPPPPIYSIRLLTVLRCAPCSPSITFEDEPIAELLSVLLSRRFDNVSVFFE